MESKLDGFKTITHSKVLCEMWRLNQKLGRIDKFFMGSVNLCLQMILRNLDKDILTSLSRIEGNVRLRIDERIRKWGSLRYGHKYEFVNLFAKN